MAKSTKPVSLPFLKFQPERMYPAAHCKLLEIRQTESRLEWSNAGLMHSHKRNTGFKSRMQEREPAPLRRKHDRFLSRFPSPSNNVGLSQRDIRLRQKDIRMRQRDIPF